MLPAASIALGLLPVCAPAEMLAPIAYAFHAIPRAVRMTSPLRMGIDDDQDGAEAVVDDLQRRLERRPNDPILHLDLARAHMMLGHTISAAMSLRRSLEIDASPSVLLAYNAVADDLLEGNDLAEAEACWRHSLSIDSSDLGVQERLAVTLRKAGKLDDAAQILHSMILALRGSELESPLYVDLGDTIDQIVPLEGTGPEWVDASFTPSPRSIQVGGEMLSAVECYERAIALDSANGMAFKRLGDMLVLTDGPAGALHAFEQAARLLPDDICCATHAFYGAPSHKLLDRLPLPMRQNVEQPGSQPAAGEEGLAKLRLRMPRAWDDEWVGRAADVFEEMGAVVLASLLNGEELSVLRAAVATACESETTLDFSSETREASHRVHLALPLEGDTRVVVDDVARRLWPLLSCVLQSDEVPLIGAGCMVVSPGAAGQELHKDVRASTVSARGRSWQ